VISASEQVTRLRALLDRIQQRASEPRPARFVAPIVVEEVEDDREPTLPGHAAAATAVEAPIEPAIAAPVELPAIEEPFAEPQPAVEPADVAEARSEAATLEEPPIEPALATYETPSVSEGTPSNETPSVSEGTPVLPDAVRIEVASFEATPPPEPILTEAEDCLLYTSRCV